MQTWSVPSADAGLQLLNVQFITTPNAGVNPVLAAATVGTVTSSVPEPASSVLLLGGLGALMARFRRRQLTA